MKKIILYIFLVFIISFNVRSQTYTHASSLWLSYNDPANEKSDILMIDFTIDSTTLYTYYAALVWDNGYAGVQRGGNGFYKHVHFSLWDPDGKTSTVIWHAPNVLVQRFGGEGTGWKSMWNFRWKEHHDYKLLVKTTQVEDKSRYDAWFFDYDGYQWKHLATFQYPEVAPFTRFSSFIEDWAGTPGNYRAYSLFNVTERFVNTKEWYTHDEADYWVNGDNPNCDAYVKDGKFFIASGGTINPTHSSGYVLHSDPEKFSPKPPEINNVTFDDETDSIVVSWDYKDNLWAAQENFKLRIYTDDNYNNKIYDSGTILSSDTTYSVKGVDLNPDTTYYLRLDVKSVFDLSQFYKHPFKNNSLTEVRDITKPEDFKLYANYPNPFNPSTVIEYSVPKEGYATIKFFDTLGNEINSPVKQFVQAGINKYKFNGSGLAGGVYFYRVTFNNSSITKSMLLLK